MLKNIVRTALVFAIVLCPFVVAQAAADGPIRVTIPFDFMVGDDLIPAGEYNITRAINGRPEVLVFRSRDGEAVTTVATHGVSQLEAPDTNLLIFHRVGDRHFLSRIWMQGNNVGRELATSDEEMSAKIGSDEEVVLAYAR